MIGKSLDHYFGFMENVRLSPPAASPLLTYFCFHSWIWKECAQVRVFSINIIVLLTVQQLIDHSGYQGHLRRRISPYGLLLL